MDAAMFRELQAEEAAAAAERERMWEQEHEDEMDMLNEEEDYDDAPPQPEPPSKRTLMPTAAAAAAAAAIPSLAVKRGRSASSGPSTTKPKSAANVAQLNPFEDSDDDDSETEPDRGDRAAAKRPRQDSSLGPGTGNRRGVVLKRQPITDSVPITLPNGRRMFLGMQKKTDALTPPPTFSKSLLQQPFAELKKAVNAMRRDTALETSAANQKKMQATIDLLSNGKGAADEGSDDDGMLPDMPASQVENALWVTKYSPRRYIDLVSDETQNRKLLVWLKTWDKMVFGREPKKGAVRPPQDDGQWKPPVRDGGSHARIALLAGPPGVGKTTLAHVIARHCGYNTIEINSSNDRAIAPFKEKVHNAIQMSSVLSVDKRPNCLVLDEIDGSSAACINFLCKLAEAGGPRIDPKDASGGPAEKPKKKKGKKALAEMRRPIICICNDINAKILRPLRKVALEITIPPISGSSLTTRVLAICKIAGVKTDARSVSALSEQTNGDIRSCLSTIQFSSGKDKTFGMENVNSMGEKDRKIGVYKVFDQIFTKQDTSAKKSTKRRRIMDGKGGMVLQTSSQALLSSIYSNNEYDKLLEGCFNNYLSIRGLTSFDPMMAKVLEVSEWLGFTAEIDHSIRKTMAMTLKGYVPYCVTAFHQKYASSSRQELSFPSTFWNVRERTATTMGVIENVLEDSSPRIRKMLNPRIIALDVVTPMLELISPYIRPVAPSLLNATERDILYSVVGTMVGYNLQYVQVREEGRLVFKLEPPLNDLVDFNDEGFVAESKRKPWEPVPVLPPPSKSGNRAAIREKRLTNNTRQLIVQEVTQARMRQRDERLHGEEAAAPKGIAAPAGQPLGVISDPANANTSDGEPPPQPVLSPDSSQVPRTKEEKDAFLKARMGIQLGNVKAVKAFERSTDFFGRAVQPIQDTRTGSQIPKQVSAVFFKFQEGFSQAVRKPLRLRDLL